MSAIPLRDLAQAFKVMRDKTAFVPSAPQQPQGPPGVDPNAMPPGGAPPQAMPPQAMPPGAPPMDPAAMQQMPPPAGGAPPPATAPEDMASIMELLQQLVQINEQHSAKLDAYEKSGAAMEKELVRLKLELDHMRKRMDAADAEMPKLIGDVTGLQAAQEQMLQPANPAALAAGGVPGAL